MVVIVEFVGTYRSTLRGFIFRYFKRSDKRYINRFKISYKLLGI